MAILGGRTMAENHAWWVDRCRRDANIGGVNWVAPEAKPETQSPEAGDDAELLRLHLERAGIPDRLGSVLRGKLYDTEPVVALRRWWDAGSSFLLLHGETGSGKSVAAASAMLKMRRVVRWDGGQHDGWASSECSFETADALARNSYFGEEAHQLVRHLGRVTCLVIDDLGAELMSEGWRATLDAILAERFGRSRCRTVITTNISAKRPSKDAVSQFEERYGSRIARRIRESGSVVAVEAA